MIELASAFWIIFTQPFYMLRLEIKRRRVARRIKRWFSKNGEFENLQSWHVEMRELNWVVKEKRRLGLTKDEPGA